MVQLPYPISGTVYDTDGTTALASVKVTVRNERTNETISQNSDSNGAYRLDLANLTSEYATADVVTIFVIYTNYEDYEEHTIDTTADGATVDLTLTTVPASNTLSIVTVQDINSYLNVTIGSNNASVLTTNDLVTVGTYAEGWVEDVCNRKFDTNSGSYHTETNEYHDARINQRDYYLNKHPVQAISAVAVNKITEGSTAVWTDLTETTDYELDYTSGRIRLVSDTDYPAEGSQQLRATYTHGDSAPAGVKRLVCMVILRDLAMGNVTANTIKGKSITTSSINMETLNTQIDAAISRYMIMSISHT